MNVTVPPAPYAIVGLGLIGGSLARALGRAFPAARLLGVDPEPRARAGALSDRAVAEALEAPGPALARCGVVFLCVPFGALSTVLPQLAPHLAPSAIVTDACSVKAPVEALVRAHLPAARWVGGHPLAGGEPGGFARSRADLFAGRPVALCPRPGEEALAAAVGTLWAAAGARPVVVSAEEHDRVAAATVHLPQLLALAAARIAGATDGAERLAGRALADATRAAAHPPEASSSAAANAFVPAAARVLADELRRFAELVESDPRALETVAAEARAARARLLPE